MLPKNVEVEFELFDENFKEIRPNEEESYEELVVRELNNKIRWRKINDQIECNSKIVEWEDGSLALVIGDEYFDIVQKDVAKEGVFLFAENDNIANNIATVNKDCSLLPVNTQNISLKNRKRTLAKQIEVTEDPDKVFQTEKQNEKDREKLNKKIQKNQLKRKSKAAKYQKFDDDNAADDDEINQSQVGLTIEDLEASD